VVPGRTMGWIMKKVLLATSAILTAGLMAAPVSAEVVNGTGVQLKISGYMDFHAGLVDEEQDSGADRDYEFYSQARINFDVSNKSDTGITYGGRVRFNNISAGNGFAINRAYIYVGTESLGRLTLGDDLSFDNTVTPFYNATTTIGGAADGLFGNFLLNDAGTIDTGAYAVAATMIKYETPDLGGFKGHVQFIPNTRSTGRDIRRTNSRTITSTSQFNTTVDPVTGAVTVTPATSTQNDVHNRIDLGATYDFAVGDFKVSTLAAYATADDDVAGDDLRKYQLAGSVGFGNATLSAEWFTYRPGLGGTEIDNQYQFAALYGLGALTLGANYVGVDLENAGDDYDQAYGVVAEYAVAPGLIVQGDLTRFDYESNDNDGYAVVLSTRVSF